MDTIRLLLADNEEVFREGLAKLLSEYPHIEVVGQSGKSEDAIRKTMSVRPDVILVSSQISDAVAEKIVTQLRGCCPEAKIAIIARPEEETNNLIEALKKGATACLAKTISVGDLVKSIDLIASGRVIVSPLFAEKFISRLSKVEGAATVGSKIRPGLSDREREITKLVVGGATSKEIAVRLFISANTVNVHIKNIMKKLELRNRQQLVAYAVTQGWGGFSGTVGENAAAGATN